MKGRQPVVLTRLMDLVALHPDAGRERLRDLYKKKYGHWPAFSTVRRARQAVEANAAGNGQAIPNPVAETVSALSEALAHAPARPADPFAEGVRALGVALRALGRERVKVLLTLLESEA
jgi:hypothetical protein